MAEFKEIRSYRPKVKLTGGDGNAWVLISKCVKVLRSAGFSAKEIEEFEKEAMSGDYDNVLRTCQRWCDVS